MTETHNDFYKRWNALAKPYFGLQLRQFNGSVGKRVCDIGCGYGNFTDLLQDKDLYVGVDSNSEFITELKLKYMDRSNIKFLHHDITDEVAVKELRALELDTVLCMNLLEHVENDSEVVENICNVLPKGGTLCILVPAFQFLFGTLDTFGFHYRRYTKASLKKILSNQPLEILKMHYFNFPGALGWFIKGRILKHSTHTNDNFHVMNAIIPLVEKIEGIIKPPIGQSLVAIAMRT
ncbi:MAG: class I SAM-dependent methyltransferase [Nitrospirae bacterium]|nr:class I SAM-dependent methyltransferase [Nitrospirota bacterium]MBF0534448.1 class I SAM-dependent methyltransferase [Nitrospirota bacterium]MBF0617074.1 class I SAM-dependent methyltransferase [Nitrospirota bacterium]